jgi:hypothetical protein
MIKRFCGCLLTKLINLEVTVNCPKCGKRLYVDSTRCYDNIRIRKYKCSNKKCNYETVTSETFDDLGIKKSFLLSS